MQPTIDADKHNFGQSVKLTDRASDRWFRKPRTVFWEHLLFGKDSPIRQRLSATGENGDASLASYLFNLETEVEGDWLGYSREVKSASIPRPTLEQFYAFGVLVGYAYALGIRDLHKNNLIITSTHLQAVDAEVVLTDLILPNESILLPFKDISFETCGLRALVPTISELSQDEKQRIFSGYFDLFAILYRQQKELETVLARTVSSAPIRVIVRNTRIYKNYLAGEAPITDLLPEELAQLERGDIPYFFKRSGDGALYWITSATGDAAVPQSTGTFAPDVARHAQIPSQLIGDAGVIQRKMVQGAFLLQKQLADASAYELGWNGRRLLLGTTGCENHYTGQVFRKKSATQQ